MPTPITENVLAILRQSEILPDRLKLPQQLSRFDYLATDKILKSVGAVWRSQGHAHIFSEGAKEKIEQIIATGNWVDVKKENNYFPTSTDLAYYMVQCVLLEGKILEPSAGQGSICKAMLEFYQDGIDVCEIYEPFHAELKALGVNINIVGTDFLAYNPDFKYKTILMNPPFAKQQDLAHVTHALDLLEKGGSLVSVMSPSFTFRADKKTTAFKARLEQCTSYEVEELPAQSFKSSGTNVNTILLKVVG